MMEGSSGGAHFIENALRKTRSFTAASPLQLYSSRLSNTNCDLLFVRLKTSFDLHFSQSLHWKKESYLATFPLLVSLGGQVSIHVCLLDHGFAQVEVGLAINCFLGPPGLPLGRASLIILCLRQEEIS